MIKKISFSIFVVSLLTLICSMSLMILIISGVFTKNVERDLESEAKLAAHAVSLVGEEYFSSLDTPNRITWISADGTVICDSQKDAGTLDNHSDREEFTEALRDGSGISRRYSSTISKQTVNYALKLSDGSVIRVSSTQHTAMALFLSMAPYFIIVCIVILMASGFFARKLSNKIVEPLNEIDLEKPEFSGAYDEISPLLHKIKRQNDLIRDQMNDLRQTAEKFQTITQNMSEGIIILDSDKRILSYNPASVHLLGAGSASIGESVLTLNRTESFAECVDIALSGSHSKAMLTDAERTYQIFANPVTLEDDECGAVIVILDVTDRERGEALRREFTSNVSHELKTPLTSIYGISEIMANGIVKPEDIPKFAQDINSESGRLITLVNDIIRLSQLDEDSFAEQKESVDLTAIAREAAATLAPAASKKQLTVTVSGERTLVTGIYSVLYEMIYNLLDNAIKYNRDGGAVTLHITPAPSPMLTVSDTGIGIPKEHISRVFERFYRVDKSHSKAIGGTGLGLSIVKHAAAYHNAEISIKSEVGKGTSVTVEFPGN